MSETSYILQVFRVHFGFQRDPARDLDTRSPYGFASLTRLEIIRVSRERLCLCLDAFGAWGAL